MTTLTVPSQPALSPPHRLALWVAFVGALSLVDLTLTTLALQALPGAQELNPVAAWALEEGPLAALFVKLIAIEIAMCICLAIAPTPFARTTEKVLIGASVVFLLVNAWSALQLLGVG